MSRAQSFSKPRLKRQKKAQAGREMEAILNQRISYASHDEILEFQLNEQTQLNPLSQQFEPGRLSLANTDTIDVRSMRSKRGMRNSEASSVLELKLQVLQDQLSVKESESAMKDHQIEELQRKLKLLSTGVSTGDIPLPRQPSLDAPSRAGSGPVAKVVKKRPERPVYEERQPAASSFVNLEQSPYKPTKPTKQKPTMHRHSSARSGSRVSKRQRKTITGVVGVEFLEPSSLWIGQALPSTRQIMPKYTHDYLRLHQEPSHVLSDSPESMSSAAFDGDRLNSFGDALNTNPVLQLGHYFDSVCVSFVLDDMKAGLWRHS